MGRAVKRRCPVAVSAERAPSDPAISFGDQTFTWAQADALTASAAQSLLQLGVQPGDRVALRTLNRPEVAWWWFGAARIGATLVPLNARLTDAELVPLVEHVQARVALGQLPNGRALELQPAASPSAPVELEDEQVIAGLFTSGTTGAPKLVELTQGNFRANAEANALRLGDSFEQRWLGVLPLFHVGGLAMLYRCAVYGAALVLDTTFDAGRACAALDHGVTHLSLVPTMLDRVIAQRGDKPFVGVKAALIGGGPMTSAQLARARLAGIPVLQTYGLTEACSQVTTEAPEDADGQSAGTPLHGVEVRIVQPDADGVGEIEVRGPTVAKGQGEWLHTKDLGALDSRGRLKIYARRTDLIVSGGENVYPAELEAVLREHPAIQDVAVMGRADEKWGQVPVAVVVLAENVADEALIEWSKARLASFKVPRAWVRVESIPRNATGKVDRSALAALVA